MSSKVPITPENEAKCVCPDCPTYMADECAKGRSEVLYCGKGVSGCELVERGCICGTCPLWTECGLSNGYFCLYGAAE